jgi:alkanesulfonate monooxygenase SsuD/methylene tetrahydromethanopterin reductase-like flavin-dependent oxidoreductase (luciferase family)
MFGPLRLVRALTDQQIEDMADPKKAPTAGLPTIEQAVASGGVLCGTPEQIIEHLKNIEASYPGLDRVMVSHPVGTPEAVILDQLQRFADEVMPAFQGQEQLAPAD